MRTIHNNSGLTLVELVLVVAIIGILSTTIYLTVKDAPHKARATEFQTVLNGIYNAEKIYESENGSFTGNIDELDIDYKKNWFDYKIEVIGDSSFIATAFVVKTFGKASAGQCTATINQSGEKTVTGGLARYAKNWK